MRIIACAVIVLGLGVGAPLPVQAGGVWQQLQDIDRSLRRAERDLARAKLAHHEAASAVVELDVEIAAAKVRSEEAKHRFGKRLRALYQLPQASRWLLLGATNSWQDFLLLSRTLRWLATHDRSLKGRHDAEATRLQELAWRKKQREAEAKSQLAAQKRARDDLAHVRQQRWQLAQRVLQDRAIHAPTREGKHRARRRLERMLGKRSAVMQATRERHPGVSPQRAFALRRGHLPWPTHGKVSLGFGEHAELAYGTVTTHQGWDIRAPAGAAVQAIAPGKVVFADWLHGYGQLVIIDHGDQYHSLVAHLEQVQVKKGVQVRQGELIGAVGDTGSLRGTVLYFEIRHQGQAISPKVWLKK